MSSIENFEIPNDPSNWSCGESMTGSSCYLYNGGSIGVCCKAVDGKNKECLGVKIGGIDACKN